MTPLSSRGLEHEAQEEVMPLTEYKLDHGQLVVVKRTLKRKRALIGGIEKDVIVGFEGSTLWDMSSLDVAWVDVETSTVIVEMALIGQSSSKAMAKEIFGLKQSATQDQNDLAKNMKNTPKEKQRSLDDMRIALEVRHE